MEFYTTSEIAEKLKVSRVAVLRWLNTGELKGHRIGTRLWRVELSDFEAFVDKTSERE